MDYRRYYGLRAPRPIGYSTFLVPQLENYSLFASPFMDLNKKLNKLVEGFRKEVMDQEEMDLSEKVIKGKGKGKGKRKVEKQSEEKKSEEDKQKLTEETSEVDVNFGIVLNVATVKSEDLSIALGEGNEIEVTVNQSDVKLGRMEITFSRNCSYKYQLPDDVHKSSLVALRTTDDFLIILPRGVLRQDLFSKSIKAAKSSDKDVVVHMETSESTDLEEKETESKKGSDSKEDKSKKGSDSKEDKSKKGSDSKEDKSKKGSDSKEDKSKKGSDSKEDKSKKGSDSKEDKSKKGSETKRKEDAKKRKMSKLDTGEAVADEVEESSKSENVFLKEDGLMPVHVSRMLRPGLDIFLLRKYIVDLESYVSTVRKFVENASFISQNSKTPEIRIRALATQIAEKYFEKPSVTDEDDKGKNISKKLSPESGYTSSDKSSEGLPTDPSDESSRSSSTKSGEQQQDMSEE